MNYEIVNLKEKTLIGISARTGNNDPRMGEIIGGLWNNLYASGISNRINNKVNQYAIGLYSDYKNDGYLVTVGNEVSKVENDDLDVKIIPAGRYAKFSVHGHMQKAVAAAWEEIWKMDLERSYTGDFEEYLNCDFEEANIDIYVALR